MIVVYYCGFICFEVLVLCNLFRYELTFSVCYLYPVFVDDQNFGIVVQLLGYMTIVFSIFRFDEKKRSDLKLKSE